MRYKFLCISVVITCLFSPLVVSLAWANNGGVVVQLDDLKKDLEPISIINESRQVASQVRSFEVDGVTYPDASLHIPVSFIASKQPRLHVFAHYVNRVRNEKFVYGCQPGCSDAEIALDVTLFANKKRSLTIQPGVQSLTSRGDGTKVGQGGYLGFRYSSKVSETLSFSVGGESVIRLDSTVDLGKNAYAGFSKVYHFNNLPFNGPIVLNLGLGSGAFSLFGNSLIETSYRSDRPDKIGDADNFDFGIVGSISFSPNENLTLGLEYSGYGLGFGPSIRPIPSIPLVATFYIYDLLWKPDLNYKVTPNIFGNLTYQFE